MKLFGADKKTIKSAVQEAVQQISSDHELRLKEIRDSSFRRGFDAARVNRLTASFQTQLLTLDQMLKLDLKNLKGRSRNLSVNNDYAKSFIRLLKNNVVGPSGFKLQNKAKDPSGKLDEAANDIIEENWAEWGKKENASVSGRISWLTHCYLFIASIAIDGEYLARRIKGWNNPFGYAIQPLETDLLDITLNKTLGNGNEIRMGIEFDKWDRPLRYYLRKRKSMDSYYVNDYEVIPASEIIHAFIYERAFQSRGVVPMASAMIAMHNIHAAEEAEMYAVRGEASKMGFLEQAPDSEGYPGDVKDYEGNIVQHVEPGEIELLPKGITFKAYDPTHPNGNFAIFKKEALKSMASGIGAAYHSFANDLENVNYSSIRQGALDERDSYKVLQSFMIEEFCNVVFSDVLEMSLLTQKIKLPFSKFSKFNNPMFYGRRWGWVDPLKDVSSAEKEISLRLKSRTEIIAESGRDFREVVDQIAEEEAYAKSKGVSLAVIDATIISPEDDENAKKTNN